jgi:hypothetical protein
MSNPPKSGTLAGYSLRSLRCWACVKLNYSPHTHRARSNGHENSVRSSYSPGEHLAYVNGNHKGDHGNPSRLSR